MGRRGLSAPGESGFHTRAAVLLGSGSEHSRVGGDVKRVDTLINWGYDKSMQIEYDPAKDAINRRKHGISLAEAERLNWDLAYIWEDARFDYGEVRMTGWGFIGADVFHVTFVEGESITRIISLRPAEKHETKRYIRHLEGR